MKMEIYLLNIGQGPGAQRVPLSVRNPVRAAEVAIELAEGRAFEVWHGNIRLFAGAGLQPKDDAQHAPFNSLSRVA